MYMNVYTYVYHIFIHIMRKADDEICSLTHPKPSQAIPSHPKPAVIPSIPWLQDESLLRADQFHAPGRHVGPSRIVMLGGS